MFGQMMSSIDDDYVKYVMHTQVQVLERPALEPSMAGARYIAPEGPVLGAQAIAGALEAGPVAGEEVVFASDDDVAAIRNGGGGARTGGAGRRMSGATPSAASLQAAAGETGSAFDHVGRNEPCPCGSGKKFKFCHGK
jgi:preprotein translocase subunit SecA